MSTEIKIKEIAFVFHPVADVERARGFYGTLLGLKVLLEMEVQPGVWWIEYNIAGAALAVSNVSAPLGSSGATLALEVEHLDDCLAALRDAKIPLTIEVQDFPPCRMFGINSPDGHPIMFHQRKL
jgi:predicted enzyme related to lactoylglutathione lyase